MTFGADEILEEFAEAGEMGWKKEWLHDDFITFKPFELRRQTTHRERMRDPYYAYGYRMKSAARYRNNPEFAVGCRARANKWRKEALKDPTKKVALQKRQREWARENAKKPGKQEEILKRQRIRHRKAREGIRPLGPAKLDKAQVLEIRARDAGGESSRTLAEVYGVLYCTVRRIVKRVTWKNI